MDPYPSLARVGQGIYYRPAGYRRLLDLLRSPRKRGFGGELFITHLPSNDRLPHDAPHALLSEQGSSGQSSCNYGWAHSLETGKWFSRYEQNTGKTGRSRSTSQRE